MAIDGLREQALALSADERGELAADLLASLAPPPGVDETARQAEWLAEISRRAERALSGEEPGEEWADVEARIRQQLES